MLCRCVGVWCGREGVCVCVHRDGFAGVGGSMTICGMMLRERSDATCAGGGLCDGYMLLHSSMQSIRTCNSH